MAQSKMRCLLFSLPLLALIGCASDYKMLQPVPVDEACLHKIRSKPFTTSWFDASVEVEGRHLGGLVLIKPMPDQSTRVVFTAEAGATIFDFEYGKDGKFQIRHIVEKLNRKVITDVLQKDFALLLGTPFDNARFTSFQANDELIFEVRSGDERAFLISDKLCRRKRAELGSKRKRLISIVTSNEDGNPEEITITHHTFDMTIDLKRIKKDVTQ